MTTKDVNKITMLINKEGSSVHENNDEVRDFENYMANSKKSTIHKESIFYPTEIILIILGTGKSIKRLSY